MKPLVFPVEVVRAYAQIRTGRTSLREVAQEVGVNLSTLHNFVRGSSPHPRTRLKLATWYAKQVPEETGGIAARNAAGVLLMGYPEEHYAAAVRALLDGVAELYLAVGAEPPPWTKEEA
jgi:transposase-like protein